MENPEIYAACMGLILAAELRERRIADGWSAYALARRAGVSDQMICNIENGRAKPTCDFIARLCSALGVMLSEFITAAENREE